MIGQGCKQIIIRTASIGGNSFHHDASYMILFIIFISSVWQAHPCLPARSRLLRTSSFPQGQTEMPQQSMEKLRLYTLVSPYLRESDFPGLLTSTFSVVEKCGGTGSYPIIPGDYYRELGFRHHLPPSRPSLPPPGLAPGRNIGNVSQDQSQPYQRRVPPPSRPALPVGSAVMAWLPWLT